MRAPWIVVAVAGLGSLLISGASADNGIHARSLLVQIDAAYVDEVAVLVSRRGGTTEHAVSREPVPLDRPTGVTAAVAPSVRPVLTALFGALSIARSADEPAAALDRVEIRPDGLRVHLRASAATHGRFGVQLLLDPYIASRRAAVRERDGPAIEVVLDASTGRSEALLGGVPQNQNLIGHMETLSSAAEAASMVGTHLGAVLPVAVEGTDVTWYERTVRFEPCTLAQLTILLANVERRGRVVVTEVSFRVAEANAQKPGVARMLTDVEVKAGGAHRIWRPKR